MQSSKAAPTGCYKCGRPGHWSRDCPDSNPIPNTDTGSTNPSNSKFSTSFPTKPNTNSYSKSVAEKPKKVPRSRPKLTPDILLGDDGLGYVLRHFPRNFKYRGRGHEVSDLGNLIRLYSEWHNRLLPYYSYDEFVHKAEQVASTKRVRTCLRDLRERVASGGDPTKLHESPRECVDPNLEQDDVARPNPSLPFDREKDHLTPAEASGLHDMGGTSSTNHDADVEQEDMLRDIFDRATEEPAHTTHSRMEPPTQNNKTSLSNEGVLTDEQRARMEANRLKALERAAARAQSLQ